MTITHTGRFTEDCAKNIWARAIVAGAEAKADFCRSQILHWTEALDEFRQQSRAGRRDQFCRLVTLRDRDAARAQDLQRGGSRNGKASVGTLNETSAFDNAAGEDLRLSQYLQGNAGADD